MNINTATNTLTLSFDEVATITLEQLKQAIASIPKVKGYSIEYVQGQEQHSSYWGKFYVKGLEELVTKEDHEFNRSDKHHSYQCYYTNLDTNHDNLFTVFLQQGSKYGVERYEFYICQLDVYSHNLIAGDNRNSGFVEGNFKIIAEGIGKTKAPRLMQWWIDNPNKSLDYALKCATAINKRGAKQP